MLPVGSGKGGWTGSPNPLTCWTDADAPFPRLHTAISRKERQGEGEPHRIPFSGGVVSGAWNIILGSGIKEVGKGGEGKERE